MFSAPTNAPRAVVIFDNFGPYHVARVAAAAERLAITAIELKGRSRTYGWNPPAVSTFRKLSLTEPGEEPAAARVAGRLTQALEKADPQVVFVNGWYDFLSPTTIRWCALRGVPFVIMSESPAPGRKAPVREWFKSRLVRLASGALVGGKLHVAYAAQLGVPATAIFTGYDAVDNQHFQQGAAAVRADATKVRKLLGLPEHYFLASKRFVPKKNIPRLLEAFAGHRADALAAGRVPWKLVLLGDGPEKAGVLDCITRLALQDAVVLPGFRAYDELPAYYGLAGAFIHASTHEEWGLVVNEAMAAGLPILLSQRCGCAPELLEEGCNGFGFDPENAQELRRLMNLVSSAGFDREAFAGAGQQRIARFSPARFGEAAEQAARCALGSKPPRLGMLDRLVLRALDRP